MTEFEKKVLESMTIHKCENSPIFIAKKEIYMPEKKIIFLDEANENEIALVSNTINKGGIIV